MHRTLRIAASLALAGLAVSPAAAIPAHCTVDIDGNGTVNIDDIDAFVIAFYTFDPAADLDFNGVFNIDDVDLFTAAFLIESPDLDGDRLSACAEAFYGTNPLNPDTDSDGLSDADETIGTTTGLNLNAMGANPLRRTIFVETDWFEGTFEGSPRNFRPTAAMVAAIQAPFANAILPNPDGSFGIDIFLDYGQGAPFTGGNKLPGTPPFITFDAQFNLAKAAHFAAARKGYFHYCVFANRYDSATNGSSGVAELNGDDLMVTLYSFFNTFNGAATFVHELGHNLGLNHGGDQLKNYKPNYSSIMNYRYQFPGIDLTGDAVGDGAIDYSYNLSVTINENAILETNGIDGATDIDWNGNAVIDGAAYARNINCAAATTTACGTACHGDTADGGDDGTCNMLTDHDDWGSINWNRLVGGDRVPAWRITRCDNWPGK